MRTCRPTSTPTTSWSIPLCSRVIRRSDAHRARPSRSRAPTRAAVAGRAGEDGMRAARFVTLVLTRTAARIPVGGEGACARRLHRAGCVRGWTCGSPSANRTRRACAMCWPRCPGDAVVVPLLLADAYHARVDIPAMIAESGADVRQADVLGEDDRLIHVLRQRLDACRGFATRPRVGVLVTAVARHVRRPTRAPQRSPELDRLHTLDGHAPRSPPDRSPSPPRPRSSTRRGASRLVIAPWFLAHGRITDRVAEFARARHCDAHRWARTGWWPRRCWIASTPPWPPGAALASRTGLQATPRPSSSAFGLGAAGQRRHAGGSHIHGVASP